MKRISVIFFLIVCFAICVIPALAAEGDSETAPGFTVTDALGNVVTTGEDETELKAALQNIADGDTVKFGRDFRISSRIRISSTEDAPRTVNFDLGGHLVYSLTKITAFSAGHYTTMNIYSSEPGGGVYITDVEVTSNGGNAFNIMGDYAVMNVGEVTVGEVTYPGSNMSAYCSCLVDLYPISGSNVGCDENSSFNVKGGTYFSISSDYSGYIIPRCGKATFNIEDADIILFETRNPLNSDGEETVLNMKNVKLIQSDGQSVKLFNSIKGTVNMENCVTTYHLNAAAASTEGGLNLIGRNVFSYIEGPMTSVLIDGTDMVQVKTSSVYELTGGGKKYTYYDKSGSLRALDGMIPELTSAYRFEHPENTQKYVFTHENVRTTEIWSKDEKPVMPYALPNSKVEGVYKSAWVSKPLSDGSISYYAGKVADFPIKVSLTYDRYLYFNIYIPAFLIDDGYLDYSGVLIGGEDYPKSDWEYCEIDGKGYYRALSGYIYEEDPMQDISLFIPFDYEDGSRVETTWTVSLGAYFEKLEESEITYSDEVAALIDSIKEDFIPDVTDDPEAPEENEGADGTEGSDDAEDSDGTGTGEPEDEADSEDAA